MSVPSKVILLILVWIFVVAISLYKQINGNYFTSNIVIKEKIQELMKTSKSPEIPTTLPLVKEKEIIVKEIKLEVDNLETITIDESILKTRAVKENSVEEETLEKEIINKNINEKKPKIIEDKIQNEINFILKNGKIIFKRLSTDVTVKSEVTIEKIAKLLNENINIKIEVAGHTDAKGEESFNQFISLKRAKSVKKMLISFGVDALRVSAKGYGESKPIVKNDGNGYSIINRRVEFNIIKD